MYELPREKLTKSTKILELIKTIHIDCVETTTMCLARSYRTRLGTSPFAGSGDGLTPPWSLYIYMSTTIVL